jgi:hypothetical protein
VKIYASCLITVPMIVFRFAWPTFTSLAGSSAIRCPEFQEECEGRKIVSRPANQTGLKWVVYGSLKLSRPAIGRNYRSTRHLKRHRKRQMPGAALNT